MMGDVSIQPASRRLPVGVNTARAARYRFYATMSLVVLALSSGELADGNWWALVSTALAAFTLARAWTWLRR